jgi:hypothetical protein
MESGGAPPDNPGGFDLKESLLGAPVATASRKDLLLFLPRSCPPDLNFLFWPDHRARELENERLSGEAESSRWYPPRRDWGRRSGPCPGLLMECIRTRSQTSQGPEDGRERQTFAAHPPYPGPNHERGTYRSKERYAGTPSGGRRGISSAL